MYNQTNQTLIAHAVQDRLEHNMDTVQEPIEDIIEKLRLAGHKITNARMAVLQVLFDGSTHLTSAEIINRVEQLDPSVGRASVFRTLELLSSMSIIRPTYLDSGAPAYVLLSREGHHSHIICTNCNSVIELDYCPVDDLIDQLERRYGFSLVGHMLEFYGICQTCLAL